MNNIDQYQKLIHKWLKGTISEAEKAELSQWYNSFPDEKKEIPESYAQDESVLRNRILDKVNDSIHVIERRHSMRRFFTRARWAAASILLLLSVSIAYYTMLRPGIKQRAVVGLYDIQPVGNQANLILSNGEVISLDQQQSELVVAGDFKYLDGKTIFGSGGAVGEKVSYAVLSTPKGGTYQLRLSDGTQVWLNASSSIRFPSEFDNDRREVELLSGEAYFSVNKKEDEQGKRVPFFVKSAQQSVQVLGTEFNVNMYNVRYGAVTTVTEGKVAVRSSKAVPKSETAQVLLTAGRQSVVDETGGIKSLAVDSEAHTAWKDGLFYFSDASIYTVMEEFGRWYDIQVRYEISSSNDLFSGYIPKDVSLGEALSLLQIAGVNFELTNNHNLIVKQNKDTKK